MADPMLIKAPIGAGDLLDRITILQIKALRIEDPDKRAFIETELNLLERLAKKHLKSLEHLFKQETAQLLATNMALWDLEDQIRALHLLPPAGSEVDDAWAFAQWHKAIALCSKRIVTLNGERARLKAKISSLCNSTVQEQKSHPEVV